MAVARSISRLVAVIAALSFPLVGCSSGDDPEPSPSPTQTSTSAGEATAVGPAFTDDDAKGIAADLSSGDSARIEESLALDADTQLAADVVEALGGLDTLVFDAKSFVNDGGGAAHVDARVDGEPWIAFLVEVDGAWKLAATSPAS